MEREYLNRGSSFASMHSNQPRNAMIRGSHQPPAPHRDSGSAVPSHPSLHPSLTPVSSAVSRILSRNVNGTSESIRAPLLSFLHCFTFYPPLASLHSPQYPYSLFPSFSTPHPCPFFLTACPSCTWGSCHPAEGTSIIEERGYPILFLFPFFRRFLCSVWSLLDSWLLLFLEK